MRHVLAATALVIGGQIAGHGVMAAEPDAGGRSVAPGSTAGQEGAAAVERCRQGPPRVISGSTVSVQRLIGMRVTNPINEDIGEVADLIIDECGRIESVVVRVGGFLGIIGGRNVKLSLEQVRIRSPNGSRATVVVVRQTRDRIMSGGTAVPRDEIEN